MQSVIDKTKTVIDKIYPTNQSTRQKSSEKIIKIIQIIVCVGWGVMEDHDPQQEEVR